MPPFEPALRHSVLALSSQICTLILSPDFFYKDDGASATHSLRIHMLSSCYSTITRVYNVHIYVLANQLIGRERNHQARKYT